MTEAVVERLYHRLVDELRRNEHPPDRPLKVADLYERIVPYRAVRSDLQVELNADYEHALLRLLAGERGLLRIEPPEARAELRGEVESAYPTVGRFRQFAASDVWVSLPDPRPDPPIDDPEPRRPPREPELPAAEPEVRPGEPPECHACAEALPGGGEVRFCPHCGVRQGPISCPDCQAEVEPGWRYCAHCGVEV